MREALARMLRGSAAAALIAASIGACRPGSTREPRAAAVTDPRSLCEAVYGFKPAAFYCLGEPRHAPAREANSRASSFNRGDRCLEDLGLPEAEVERQTPPSLAFDFDLMADERGRIPVTHLVPWSRSKGFLDVTPGVIAHVHYRFDNTRLERSLKLRQGLGSALADPERRDRALSCLDDLCYAGHKASLARYVARPHITVVLEDGEITGAGWRSIGRATYTTDLDDEIVLAARSEPGPSVAGPLCRASADDKMRRSVEHLAHDMLASSACLVPQALIGLLDTSCAGRACAPADLEAWQKRTLGDVRRAMPAACQAIDRELHRRQPGRSLRCGPDVAAFAEAHPKVTLGEVFSSGPESLRLGLVRSLLDAGDREALSATADWLSRRSGGWATAQASWEAARRYDSEIPSLPASSWRDFQTSVLGRLLDVFSKEEVPNLAMACADETIAWTPTGWAVVPLVGQPGAEGRLLLRSGPQSINRVSLQFAATLTSSP